MMTKNITKMKAMIQRNHPKGSEDTNLKSKGKPSKKNVAMTMRAAGGAV